MRDKEEREGEGASVKVQKRRSGGKKEQGEGRPDREGCQRRKGREGRCVEEERERRGGEVC